jgi:hypothetical protein
MDKCLGAENGNYYFKLIGTLIYKQTEQGAFHNQINVYYKWELN